MSVATQPTGMTCSVANATGTMLADVATVQVTCSPQAQTTYSVGGSITGLTQDGLQLVNNSNGDQLTVSAGATSFMMGQKVASGSIYDVAVHTNPTGQTCTVQNGSSTMGAGNVNNVVVTCTLNSYTLSGTITGLAASGLVLSNGTETLPIGPTATSFRFVNTVAYTSAYAVGVATQPSGMTCGVTNGSGTMPAAPVTNVLVRCLPLPYNLGGTVNGLTQAGLVLANGGDTLTVSPNGGASVAFALQPVAYGSNYQVTVQTQPTGQTCTVQNGSGTMGAGNVTNVVVNCTLNSYTLGGSVSGLNLGGLTVVKNLVLANGTDAITVQFGQTSFTFGQPVAYGSMYNVVVQQQPSVLGLVQLTCAVSNGGGVMGAGNVTNVVVTCL